MSRPPVLIVGAGPVGLTLAAFLSLNDVAFRIIDSKSGPVEDSRALGVHARTLELMRPTGLDKEFVRHGRITRTMRFYRKGSFLFSLNFKKLRSLTPYPFLLLLPQSSTERILEQWLARRGVAVEWGSTLAHLEQRGARVEVRIARGEGTQAASFDYVAACDGASSFVREAMGINFSGDTYKAKFLLAEAEIEEDKIATNASHVFLSDNTTVAILPMPNGKYRIVGPDFSTTGSDSTVDFAAFKQFLHDNELLRNVTLKSADRLVSYRVHKRIADTFARGRVFLAGDAAHIHSPAGGQGMNTGMQDAVNLAWKIAMHVHGRAGDGLLASYASERRQVAEAVVAGTDRALKTVLSKNPLVAFGFRYLAPVLFKFGTPSSFMQSTAQLNLSYAGAGIKRGAETIAVGSRFPWIPFNEAQDSLDLFDGRNYVLFILARCGAPGDAERVLYHARRARSIVGAELAMVMLHEATYFRPSGQLLDARSAIEQRILPPAHAAAFARLDGAVILVRPDGYVESIGHPEQMLSTIASTLMRAPLPEAAHA